jgi:cation transport ATPase
MKTPFQRILPILNGVLFVCGILFVFLQLKQINTLSQKLEQIDTLSQQLQHRNNHVTGVLSEEGGKGPSPTRPDADQIEVATKQMHEATKNPFQEINNQEQEAREQEAREQEVQEGRAFEAHLALKNRRASAIIVPLVVMIVGLIVMAVFLYIRERLKRLMGVALIIKNILVIIVGLYFTNGANFFFKPGAGFLDLCLCIALGITAGIVLVYTFRYVYYGYRDCVHGGYGEIKGRIKSRMKAEIKKAKITKIAKIIFHFFETFVILVILVIPGVLLSWFISLLLIDLYMRDELWLD